jgi:hypothetical protein
MPFPIDFKYIESSEKKLGLMFPDSFKNRMCRENGGTVTTKEDDWQLFPFFDEADQKRMNRTANHIVLETKQARNWANFPLSGIAIASNGSGDFLILLPTEQDEKILGAEIFSWYHETGEVKEVAKSIKELRLPILKPVYKKQVQKSKLNSLRTAEGFSIDNIPSPWMLTETITEYKPPCYTFQIGKGTDCLVSLETAFPTQKSDADKFWFDQWKKETGLKPNTDDLIIEKNEVENYSVSYWIKHHQTEKWYLKIKTSLSRHTGDFKEFIKILNNIQVESNQGL